MDLEKLGVPRALLKVCHCDTPVLCPLKQVSLLYNSLFSMPCVLPLKPGTVFALHTPSGTACPLPGQLESSFLKPRIAIQIITAIISLLFVSLARESANTEAKHCRKKSASFVPWTPDLVCHSAKAMLPAWQLINTEQAAFLSSLYVP